MNTSQLICTLAAIPMMGFTGLSKDKKLDRPNIIFILADDLGYGDVSCYNKNSKIHTPNIDQLATQGVRFTDAHTSSAVCTPTRYGILTGRYNWRSTLKRSVLNGFSKALIPKERETVASFLQKNGYQTACIGKWHLGWEWNSIDQGNDKVDFSKKITNGPTSLGFDYFFGFCGSLDMPPYVWVENDQPTMVPTKKTGRSKGQDFWREGLTSDDFVHDQALPDITTKAKNYIAEKASKEKPFFLYLPLPAPHTPILPTKDFQGKSKLENPYGDFVIMVDWAVGEISRQLEEAGISDNTLLIFTSDNGCSPTADFDQLATKDHDPSYVFRGTKADIFEGGHRVPYIVCYPDKIKPSTSNQIVCTTDLFATVADLIGEKYGENTAEDSFSFLPALRIKSKAPARKSIVHHSIDGSFAIREKDWKVIFCSGSGGWSYPRPGKDTIIINQLPSVQLYNLKTDIGEEHNLQAEHPEIIKEYQRLLTDFVRNGRSTIGTAQKNDGPLFWPELKWMEN